MEYQGIKKVTSITWAIQNFSCCWQKKKKFLTSPTFSINAPEETKWKLILYPRGFADGNYIAFFLNREDSCSFSERLEVEYCLEILRADFSILKTAEGRDKFEVNQRFGFPKFLQRKTLENKTIVPQDVLTLRCRIKRFVEKAIEIRQIFARTIINVERISFIWRIEQFSQMAKEEAKSFVIKSALDFYMIKIDLSLTNERDTEENVSLSMRSYDHYVKFSSMRTFILDSQKREIDSGEFKCFFESGKGLTHLLRITNNMIMENKDLYLPEDVLSLGFEMAISTGILYEGLENVEYSYTTHQTTNEVVVDWLSFSSEGNSHDENNELKADLMSLYREKSLCDMKLKTETKIFPVHTTILGARSPVFKAMFSSDMKENVNRCVDMSDLQEETVRRFLLYLYSDQLEDLKWDDALQLYMAADKYAVPSLVYKCSTVLKNNLNLENACEALMHSDLHQDESFKEIAQNFVLKNANTIFKSEVWKILADANPKLAAETMIRNWNDD